MINGHTDTKTYRGESLEELLPRIAEELGPDAVITRQRDGIVGGIGGFFGKKILEVEARPAERPPTLPAGVVLDAYDDGSPLVRTQGEDTADAMDPETREEPREAAPEPAAGEASSGATTFAQLVDELAAANDEPAAEEEEAVPAQPASAQPASRTQEQSEQSARPNPIYEGIGVGHSLVWSGLSSEPVASLIGSVLRHSSLFSAEKPLAAQVKAALAQQIPTATGWTTERHVLALVGTARSGRTHAAAAIARAYAHARIATAVLSLESPRTALRLGALIEAEEIGFDVAASRAEIDFALRRLSSYGLVVVDTPAFATSDPQSIERVARLLDAVGVDAVHLLVPAGLTADAAGAISAALAGRLDYTHIMVTQLDRDTRVGGAVGLAIGTQRPISYLMAGNEVTVPDAYELAERVLA